MSDAARRVELPRRPFRSSRAGTEADLAELARVHAPADGAGGRGPLAPGGRGRGRCCSSSTAPSRRRCTCPAIARWRSGGPARGRGASARSRCSTAGGTRMSVRVDRDRDRARARPAGLRGAARRASIRRRSALKRRLAALLTARLRDQLAAPRRLRSAARRPPPEPRGRGDRRAGVLRPARQQVRASAWRPSTTSISLALWGFLTSGRVRPVPAGPHAARRGGAVDGLLPDDQRRGREGARPRRPPHPRRARRGRGRRSATRASSTAALSGHRDHPRAGAPARPAARPVRAAVQRGGRASPAFLDVVQRDLMATLRQTLRPHARLALS